VQAAHIRMACPERGKRETGKAEKPSDCYSTPLCARCHLGDQHTGGEAKFWRRVGIDPFEIAEKLYAEFDRVRPIKRDVDSGPKSKVSNRTSVSPVKTRRPKRKWPKRKMR
jgi:hypothetical protein